MVTAIRDLQYLPFNQLFDTVISVEIDGNGVSLTVGVVTRSSPNDERDIVKKKSIQTKYVRNTTHCELRT